SRPFSYSSLFCSELDARQVFRKLVERFAPAFAVPVAVLGRLEDALTERHLCLAVTFVEGDRDLHLPPGRAVLFVPGEREHEPLRLIHFVDRTAVRVLGAIGTAHARVP